MFSIYDGRKSFYQWDLDRKLIVNDNTITEVHFCNKTDDCSLVCKVYEEKEKRVVSVPNIILQDNMRITAYGYDSNYTKHSACFDVIKRSKPADYVYTETEVVTVESIVEKATEDIRTDLDNIHTDLDNISELLSDCNTDIAANITDISTLKNQLKTIKQLSNKYDLKAGYNYTENIYIDTKGNECNGSAYGNCKCTDYVPIEGGISYTMFGIGYALYNENKQFLSAVIDKSGNNSIKEFVAPADGYVRLSINSQDLTYSRFCKTSEMYYEMPDYEQEPSPFFNPRIPCDVHLYGDSNSEGYGLADKSKGWANRLGARIMAMKTTMYNTRFSGFGEKETADNSIILKNNGYVVFSVYTDAIVLVGKDIEEIKVVVDGVELAPATSNTSQYKLDMGLHKVELYGVNGTNKLNGIAYKRTRTFTNHAKFGNYSSDLPTKPEGGIAIVMYGTNDRAMTQGSTYSNIWRFYQACLDYGVKPIIFTPIPTAISGETHNTYISTIGDIISMLPPDCINVYKDLQLIEFLGGETLFKDNVHLNDKGHKLLYAIAASKLQLAALTSELMA